MNGYAGKILRIDLTDSTTAVIPTRRYARWVGGHGMGSAIFWDLVEDKTISGFDPRNIVTVMTSPLTGTLTPGASARTEVQGIGVQSSPIEWFTRSNFGGRFGAMLKFAGWDGIVIGGKAPGPVWVDIRNDRVAVKNATGLWGLDTWDTQKKIWAEVRNGAPLDDWSDLGADDDPRRTTQRSAVMAIGPAGENQCRLACIVHDAGSASGQGGFGAVWGSKNLKAISVIGTGSIGVADPKALVAARIWARDNYSMDVDDAAQTEGSTSFVDAVPQTFGRPPVPVAFWQRPEQSRPKACVGCHAGCRSRHGSGLGNESSCLVTELYTQYDLSRHSGFFVKAVASLMASLDKEAQAYGIMHMFGKQSESAYIAADLVQRYGINAYELYKGIAYLRALYKKGHLGPGRAIDCDLPFEEIGGTEFIEKLVRMIAFREGAGDDMAEGFYRAAGRWGRQEKDLKSGLLDYPYWGLPEHGYDPRAEIEWGYGSIMGDRDINEHDFNFLFWMPTAAILGGKEPVVSAGEAVTIVSEKLKPWDGDLSMLDFSDENMYSESMVKLVSWHRYYTRFWKQSVLYCDLRYCDFINTNRPDNRGITGEGEPRFFKAVTGENIGFEEGIEIGRRIWNLDNAIWVLQGRHRDMVQFADYIYEKPFLGQGPMTRYYMPCRENGQWAYRSLNDRALDRSGFERWKTRFYRLQGWDPRTGWPRRSTLDQLGLGYVSDELAARGRIGIEAS